MSVDIDFIDGDGYTICQYSYVESLADMEIICRMVEICFEQKKNFSMEVHYYE